MLLVITGYLMSAKVINDLARDRFSLAGFAWMWMLRIPAATTLAAGCTRPACAQPPFFTI
jgi:hypothetical protein